MKVLKFNKEEGLYFFELEYFKTNLHAHPVVEILFASAGSFSITTPTNFNEINTIAIIDKNIKHSINTSSDCKVNIWMFEHYNSFIHNFLKDHKIELKDGIYCEESKGNIILIKSLIKSLEETKTVDLYDVRITKCLHYLNSEDSFYKNMMEKLKATSFLSESRLSHLFRANIGISIKRYFVWCQLKKAILHVVDKNENLFSASFLGGFHDQAHLSKAFKEFFGITPSKIYNSRMLQE